MHISQYGSSTYLVDLDHDSSVKKVEERELEEAVEQALSVLPAESVERIVKDFTKKEEE